MLTHIRITSAKPAEKAYNLRDGIGLHLTVRPNGSKLWRMNYRFLHKQKTLHLGPWPAIGRADARSRRDQARKQIAAVSARRWKRSARRSQRDAAANTFEVVAKEWLVKCERDGLAPVTIEKTAWLLTEAYPLIGRRRCRSY